MTATRQLIRAFIAISLPASIKDSLAGTVERLQGQMPEKAVRWVRPQNMHLTLRFLGDTDESQLPAIGRALDECLRSTPTFTLGTTELGTFPNRSRPRVIWVGLGGQTAQLAMLKLAVDEALISLGWPRESRPFRAHLTIGRVKDVRRLRGVDWGTEVETLPLPVTAVHVIESQLRPDGPVYHMRHTTRLTGIDPN